MANAKSNKPEIVQMFDKYVDREYYKINKSFFHSSETLVRTDRLSDSTVLRMNMENLPDEIYVNGELYKLTKENK